MFLPLAAFILLSLMSVGLLLSLYTAELTLAESPPAFGAIIENVFLYFKTVKLKMKTD